jgi:glutathione S-transferase
MTDRLVGLAISPWTERVRFALDVLGVPYGYVEHVPMVTEPWIRLRARRLTGRVSVPVWLPESGPAVFGSMAIVRSLDRRGRLFPDGEDKAVEAWEAISQSAASALRGRTLERMARSPAALEASLPPPIPRPLRPALRSVSAVAVAFIGRKYGSRGWGEAPFVRALDAHLVGDRLSYADLAMGSLLQGVLPVADRFLRLPSAIRDVWADDDLARRYDDLVAWRDALYDEHRGPRARDAARRHVEAPPGVDLSG